MQHAAVSIKSEEKLVKAGSQSTKELPRVNRAQDPVEDQKSQLLSFSEILLEFCCILVKGCKNIHFTEFFFLYLKKFLRRYHKFCNYT